MSTEQQIAGHYAHGSLEQAILDALVKAGKDVDRLTVDDLAPVDEFHIGGREATAHFGERLCVAAGAHLLDIGCGIGGPSRYFAHRLRCRVTGIDLTDEYVRVAASLAGRLGLAGQVDYRQGSALDLPFAAASFDGAYMIHVGMNIEDKARLFAGIRTVLKPGGTFGIYEVMREGEGDLDWPMPWAGSAATSFVETLGTYRRELRQSGFTLVAEENRRAYALDFFQRMRARIKESGPPPLGLHIVMGPAAPKKVANMMAAVEQGRIAPVEIVARAI